VIVLVDTDVLIDFALGREPFARPARRLLDALQQLPGTAFLAWHSISNFYYLVSPKQGAATTKDFLLDLAHFVAVAPTTTDSLRTAGHLEMADFEDAMQAAAALACRADVIATRNLKNYARSPVPAAKPGEVLRRLQGG
jgi:predicted nucleic acid-binding protein